MSPLRFLLLLAVPASASVLLIGQVLLPEPTPQGTAGVFSKPLQIQSQSVSVQVENALAETTIEWVFYNQHHRPIEGTFYLPLPQSAVIQEFEMDVNGRKTPAELLDGHKAQKIYEDIVRRMVDPALLEYQRAGLLKARIFPIEARGTKRVSLTYRHPLPKPGTFFEYHLALNKSNPPFDFRFEAEIKDKQPLQTVYAPNFSFKETRSSPHSWSLHFHKADFQAAHDLRLYIGRRNNKLGLDLLTHSEGDEHTFMLRLTPALPNQHNQTAKDILFVVDTSGSMAGEKMEQAKRALTFCLNNLGPEDRFSIVTFATETRQLATSWLPNDKANLKRAVDFIDHTRALGGTNLEEALDAVKAMPKAPARPMMVMLLSDGKPTIGTRDTDTLVGKVGGNAKRIFVLGIGLKTNTILLDRLAEKAGATSFHVLPEEDLEIKVSDLYRHIQYPILSDIQFECRGVTLEAVHPKNISDLFAGRPLTLLGRFKGSGKATFVLSGLSSGKTKRFEVPLHFRKNESHDFLPRLWAQRRIAFLLEEYRKGDADAEVKESITRLAKRYGIVTPFTAYLIVEDEEVAVNTRQRTLGQAPAPMRDLQESQGRSSVVAVKRLRKLMESVQVEDAAAEPEVRYEQAADGFSKPKMEKKGARVRYAAGRAFYRHDALWRDSEWPNQSRNVITITYNSEAWWRLYRDDESIRAILALGPELQFTHKGKHYKISR